MVLVTAPATGSVFFIEVEMTCSSSSRIRDYEGRWPFPALPLGCRRPRLVSVQPQETCAPLHQNTARQGPSSSPPSQEPATEPPWASPCLSDVLTTHCCSSQEAPATQPWPNTWISPTPFLCLHPTAGVVFPATSQPSWEKSGGTILLCSIPLPYTKRRFG